MKTFFKRLLITLAVLLLLIVSAPFVFIQFGSESSATSAKMVLNAIIGYGVDSPEQDVIQQRMKVPAGLNVQLYAGNLGKIRFMHITEQGDLLISRPRSGDIIVLERDANGDGLPDGQRTLMEGLVKPHGIDVADGWLYIAESTAIGKVQFDSRTAEVSGDYQRIVSDLNDGGNHWTKTVGMGPDGWLYFTSGSTCNVCVEEDEYRAAMMRVQIDGSGFEIVASGLRNSVGFDWAPWDQSLYATDNGRDMLGDDFPPCELNKIELGAFYGWPYLNGFGQPDPDVKAITETSKALVETAQSPAHGFRAHNAPLGISFLRHSQLEGFDKTALVALHGSWNRGERDGYKVVALQWQDDGSITETDFLTGFKGETDVIGRPADVVEGRDGTIYVSDDYSGAVYRISYGEQAQASAPAVVTADTAIVDPQQAFSVYSEQQLAELKQQGLAVFQRYNCSSCHNDMGNKSATANISLNNITSRYSLTALADYFLVPTPPMPTFPLTESERKALAVYLYSL